MENKTTFKVCDMKKEIVDQRYIKPFNKTNDVLMYTEEKTSNYKTMDNGFVGTIRLAYNQHHALIIKPDDVWIAIMVQFASYMSAHAEELRDKFVTHEGKKELNVNMLGGLYTCDYGRWCHLITDEIVKNVKDPSIREWVMPDFSTTSEKDKLAGAAVLMGTMKQYFSYKATLLCGLTEVTMLGTVADWEKIQSKARRLLEFDCKEKYLSQWYVMLEKVLEKFTESKRGSPDVNWWNRVCSNYSRGSGSSYLSGWITVFSVFNEKGVWIGGKHTLNLERMHNESEWPIIASKDVPSGCVRMDVTVDDNGTEYKCELSAGHGGCLIVDEMTLQPNVEVKLCIKKDVRDKPRLSDLLSLPFPYTG
jgi:hypothetical protein